MIDFNFVKSNLRKGQRIKNWTVLKGYIGEPFDIVDISNDYILVKPESASVQMIPKKDFEKMISLWKGYLEGNVLRKDIRDQTRFSKYIISILHFFKVEIDAQGF